MASERIETSVATIWLGDDGVLRTIIKPKAAIALADAEAIFAAHLRLLGGTKALSFVDMRQVKSADREAREYLATRTSPEYGRALALVVGSPISRIVGNFFLGLNRPAYPTRLFTVEAEALAWLEEMGE